MAESNNGVGLLVVCFLVYSAILGDGLIKPVLFLAIIFVAAPLIHTHLISKMFKDEPYRNMIFISILLILLAIVYAI